MKKTNWQKYISNIYADAFQATRSRSVHIRCHIYHLANGMPLDKLRASLLSKYLFMCYVSGGITLYLKSEAEQSYSSFWTEFIVGRAEHREHKCVDSVQDRLH